MAEHDAGGSTLTRRLPGGGTVTSRWVDFHAHGEAVERNAAGEVVRRFEFERGRLK